MSHFRPDQAVVRYFTMSELACKCGRPDCRHKTLDDIADARSMSFFHSLSDLRHELGVPITVHSGMRCPVHNAEIGGAPDSAHIYDVAADVSSRGCMWYDIANLAEAQACYSGIIVYPAQGFVHLDQHPTAHVRRGYDLGKRDRHIISWGDYGSSVLVVNEEWNLDYEIPKPRYIIEADIRMRP